MAMNPAAEFLIHQWASWCKGIKYYGPPDIKSQMEQWHRVGGGEVPDRRTNPEAYLTNRFIEALRELEPGAYDSLICIYAKDYLQKKTPVKVVAGWHRVSVQAIYQTAHSRANKLVQYVRRNSTNT